MKKLLTLTIVLLAILGSDIAQAHPGRTAGDGCHYCRTNCAKWGETAGDRHCHNGYSAPTPTYTAPKAYAIPKAYIPTTPSCPTNASYSSSSQVCLCDSGYAEVNGKCIIKQKCERDNHRATISRIIDGDTIAFSCYGREIKIRIIGIDTPETVHPRKPIQCYGPEASTKMKELVLNREVILQKGKISDNKDKYNRLLRYIYLDKLGDVGEYMIMGGYASSYENYGHDRLNLYHSVETGAKAEYRGMWDYSKCNYQNKPVKTAAQATHEGVETIDQPASTKGSGSVILEPVEALGSITTEDKIDHATNEHIDKIENEKEEGLFQRLLRFIFG